MTVRLDVRRPLVALDGTELHDPTGYMCSACGHNTQGEAMTLRSVCVTALTARERGGKAIDGKTQVERYQLAMRIHNEDEVELTNKEAAMLQELVAAIYAPLVTGQVWLLLEGE